MKTTLLSIWYIQFGTNEGKNSIHKTGDIMTTFCMSIWTLLLHKLANCVAADPTPSWSSSGGGWRHPGVAWVVKRLWSSSGGVWWHPGVAWVVTRPCSSSGLGLVAPRCCVGGHSTCSSSGWGWWHLGFAWVVTPCSFHGGSWWHPGIA